MPLVSVIVPVRNGERHLDACLETITSQTLTDLEVIVVDDGSTDTTADIIDAVAAEDPRVRRMTGPAIGSAGAARNAGLAVATGDHLAFLDGDDSFSPTLLEELHAKAVADDADIVLTRFRVADERTGAVVPVEWGLRLEHFPRRTPFSPDDLGDHIFLAVNPAAWNKLFKAEFVARGGLRFQELHRANDIYFTSLALATAERISYVESYGIDYRIGHDTSLQSTLHESPLDFADALLAIRDGLHTIGRWPALERAFVNQAVEASLTALRKAGTAESFAAIHEALRGGLLERFGVIGRPAGYFLRPDYPGQVASIQQLSTSALLFERSQAAERQAARARAEARTSALEVAGRPAPAARPATTEPPDDQAAAVAPRRSDPPEPSAAPTAPDVTVIIPVHNTQRYLRECLASVLGQGGVSVEVICVDDGSSDASPTLLDRIAADDDRVVVLHQPHAGQSVARNAALGRACGRYVCFLDSDDYWHPDGLAELVRHADDERLDLLLFDALTVRDKGISDRLWKRMATYYQRPDTYRAVTSGPDLLARLKADERYRASACLYLARRSLIEESRTRFYPGISREDDLFTFSLMLDADRAAHVPVELYRRRLREGSLMTTGGRAVAARGYFVCTVEMLRLVQGREFDPGVAEQVGAVVHRILQQARDQSIRLDPEVFDRLKEVDPGADAQALHKLLAEARTEAQFRAEPARRANRSSGQKALRRLRKLAGHGRRALRRAVGRVDRAVGSTRTPKA